MYSNKTVPDSWKNKFHYHNDMLKLFSKDERFVAYLGKGTGTGSGGENNDSRLGSTQSTFPKLASNQIAGISEATSARNNNEQEGISTNQRVKTASHPRKYTIMKKQTEYNEKDIMSILDDFRNAYPIQKPEIIDKNKTMTGFKNNGWLTMRHMKNEDKQIMFKTSIYSNLLPSKDPERAKSSKPKVKVEEKKTDFGPFLNFDYEAFNKKIEITNPVVKKQLESINYFGPFYSHCPSCKNRNLEFYQNMESNQCIQLLKCIKKQRGKTAIVKDRQNKTNQLLSIHK